MAQRYEKYKDSGVQWLGEIPEHWGCVRLKNLGKCQNGVSKGGDYFGEGYPFVSYSDAYKNIVLPQSVLGLAKSTEEDRKSFSVEKGDVLFTRTSETIDEIGFASTCLETIKDSVFAGFLIRFRPNTNVIVPEFYKYYFRSSHLRKFFTKEMNIVTRASLSQQLLGQLNVLIPALNEQEAISNYLDTKCGKIDEWLAKKQKEVEHLQELKQRIIADAVTRGLNPEVKMKETNIPWLPEVPEHWDCVKLKAFCKDNKEKNKNNIESCVLSLSYGNVIVKQNINFGLVPDNYENYQIVNPGYIILRLTDLQNDHRSLRTGLVKNRGIITSAYIGLIVSNMECEYIHLVLHSYDVMKVFYGMGGGLRQSMSFQDISNLYIPVPPFEEQRQIVSYITEKTSKIDTLITNINKEIENIKEYKQRLISDVVTGQIKVC